MMPPLFFPLLAIAYTLNMVGGSDTLFYNFDLKKATQMDYAKYCSKRDSRCSVKDMSLPVISLKSLTEALGKVSLLNSPELSAPVDTEKEHTLYFIVHTDQLISSFGDDLDSFIAAHPWWIVREMPYDVELKPIKQRLVLQLLPPYLEKLGRLVGAHRYPSADECEHRPIFMLVEFGSIGIDVGGIHVTYGNSHRDYLLGTYDHRGQKCNDCKEINKWEGLFLQTTNCTLPELATNPADITDQHNTLYLQASKDSLAAPKDFKYAGKRFELPQEYHKEFGTDFVNVRRSYFDTHELTHAHRLGGSETVWSLFYMWGYSYRANHKMLLRIQKLLAEFRYKEQFPPHAKCITVHVRLGDRYIPGEDMFEYCRKVRAKEIELTYGQMMDMGCELDIPFGGISMDLLVDAARALMPTAEHILMITDDQQWVDK